MDVPLFMLVLFRIYSADGRTRLMCHVSCVMWTVNVNLSSNLNITNKEGQFHRGRKCTSLKYLLLLVRFLKLDTLIYL